MRKVKETWIEEQCQGIEENLQKNNSMKAYERVKELTSSKKGRTTTIQDKAGKCLTEEQDIRKRWTEYCSELYTHTTTGNPKVLDVPPTSNNNNYLILQEEIEAAVKSPKKGKSVGVDNIPLELVQAGGDAIKDICYSLSAIRSGRQESGQHLGLSPWSSLSQRKATYNYAKTTIPSAWSVTQVG